MATLYVTQPGAQVEKEYQRLLVTLEDEILLRVPIQKVSQVVLVGRVGITTPALHALLEREVPVQLVRRNGQLIGRLQPPTGPNLNVRSAQHHREEDEGFRLRVSSAIVRGKLHNQRVLALRILRRRKGIDHTPMHRLRQIETQVTAAKTIEALLGFEGIGAKAYFSIYRQAFHPQWAFDDRNRRPPRDPINALLSLGYSHLTHVLSTSLEITGLDPYLGIFHQEKYGRPALALDTLEEFRAPFVDSLVMSVINRGLIQSGDFITESGLQHGVRLTENGLRCFLREFGDRLESEVHIAGIKKPLSYRKIFEVQANRLKQVMLGNEKEYRPFLAR